MDHDGLRARIEARLALARAALDSNDDWTAKTTEPSGPVVGPWWERDVEPVVWQCDDELDGCPEEARGWIAEARFIAAHDPADAIRRHEAALRVFNRHPDQGGRCRVCVDGAGNELVRDCAVTWPCGEIRDLAESYGVDLNGETTEAADG